MSSSFFSMAVSLTAIIAGLTMGGAASSTSLSTSSILSELPWRDLLRLGDSLLISELPRTRFDNDDDDDDDDALLEEEVWFPLLRPSLLLPSFFLDCTISYHH